MLLAGAAWMATLPETMSWFAGSVWMWIGLVPLAYFGAMSFIQKKRVLCIFCNYMAFGMTLVMTIVLAALREVLRFVTFLEGSGYDALAYKITMDWPSTVIFFTTFLVVGGLNLTYLLSLAWKSGQTEGVYQPSAALSRVGVAAIASLALWVAGYFAIGIAVVNG